jgi:hypothetical protein
MGPILPKLPNVFIKNNQKWAKMATLRVIIGLDGL